MDTTNHPLVIHAPEGILESRPLPPGKIEVITCHMNADFDAVASMIAAGRLYPEAVIVFPGSQEKNIRNYFIQSVIYLFNVAKVKDIDFDRVGRLILVDTRQPSRIGPLEPLLSKKDLSLHIYDHHPPAEGDLKGEIEVVNLVGSNVTIMTEIMAARRIEITPEEATVLALGIYEDTGSFTFGSTTTRDFMAAAYLLEQGADLNVVAEMTARELTVDQVGLLNELINNAQVHHINGTDIVLATASVEHYVDEMAVLVNKMMDMEDINVLFALALMDGRIQIVARSRNNKVNVGDILKHLGGGGHFSAAAATIKDSTLPQTVVKLLRILTTELGPLRTARDIMAHPIISVGPDTPLDGARELFVRYDINTILVIGPEQTVLGYVTRQNVDKALHHDLPGYSISDLMASEFGVIGPNASFNEIQSLIIEQRQQVVPVVENGRPLGVITRTDLLNILSSETEPSGGTGEGGRPNSKKGRTKMILSLMRERLPKNILDLLSDLGRSADRLGYPAYAVGGFVRDIILRQENFDIDIVIEGDAIRFTSAYVKEHPEVRVRQHQKFNTAVLIFPDNLKIDVTTARMEYYEQPGALPIVEQGSIQMDMYRRDFTINTLAISLSEKNFGMVIDYFRGLKDIKEGFIRVLHNLSFVEDPTRVFRAIRFEQRFGFKIGKMTLNLIQNAVKHNFFLKLSGKRLSGEIQLIFREDDPGPAVERLAEMDLLKFIHPGLVFDRSMVDLFRRVKKVRDWFQLAYLGEPCETWLVYFLALLTNLSRLETEEVARRLIYRKRERQILSEEKILGERALGWLVRHISPMPSELYYLLAPLSVETVLYIMAKTTREDIVHLLITYLTRLKHVQTEMTGHDLIALGLSPGPEFKRILERLLEARLNGLVHSKAEEEAYFWDHFDLTVD